MYGDGEKKKNTQMVVNGQHWNIEVQIFPPPYEPLQNNVNFFYHGLSYCTEVKLEEATEEIMTFYAHMLDRDYTSKEVFNNNFMTDWRKSMAQAELSNYFKPQTEQREAMEYGFGMWEKNQQPVGNYKIEPLGLFRGLGKHPKMGRVKKRINPEDIIINIGRETQIPKPPEGHHWKEVRHDNKVS
ncbi:unnamed protein product [Rotaria socialis]|uniref:DNA topoisomerase I DNA binding eukaryotic-type domain-containing protein n=1 Tax=Rotaria socialis TaxID=392032 RepID=A0A820NMN3_9BILA|nr:unnamed protein product [Rotaria socialis]CAF4344510.1 unnamed protein product [Rotaria socialis]CAF4391002.1 unnamed protein product [Rotaria socialis]